MFLKEGQLTRIIQQIMLGDQPRMAVAFLGRNLAANVFDHTIPADLRVVCDILMGSTNPDALIELVSAGEDIIRYSSTRELHSKVYISEAGAVVASANASEVALRKPEQRLEVGVFIEQNEERFPKIADWFEEIWLGAKAVDEDAIKLAELKFSAKRSASQREKSIYDSGPKSLLTSVMYSPECYEEIGFLFTDEEYDEQVASDAQKEPQIADMIENSGLRLWPITGTATTWKEWPERFINVHMWKTEKQKRKRFSITKYEKRIFHTGANADENCLFCSEVKLASGPEAFSGVPKLAKISKSDSEILAALDEGVWDGLYSADEFREMILQKLNPPKP